MLNYTVARARRSLRLSSRYTFGKRKASSTLNTGKRKTFTYDVVVVGSGCSGLTAALVAAKHGLKVLVVEKTEYFGGTTAYSGGGLWIPNNLHQKTLGIADSEENARDYLQHVLGSLYEPIKVSAYLKSAPEMVKWMEKESDVHFKPVPLPDYHSSVAGASSARTILTKEFDGRSLGAFVKKVRYPLQGYSAFGSLQADPAELGLMTQPFSSLHSFVFITRKMSRYAIDLLRYGKGAAMANGNALVGRLLYSLQKEGVEFWSNTTGQQAITEDGRVTGLEVVKDNEEISISVRSGVVLAGGGFGRSEKSKNYVPHDWCASPRGNTGDSMQIGVNSGGVLPPKNPMNAIYAPISLLKPSKGPVRCYPHFAIDRAKPGSIIVDSNGQRFANEAEPYQEFVHTMHQKGIKKAYYIGDRNHLRKYGMGMALPWPYPIQRLLRQGYLITAPSISVLAEKIGVPFAKLQATVDECNHYASTGIDTQFHRGESVYDKFYGDPTVQPNPNLGICAAAPFYALPIYPGNVSTMYGLLTNSDAQVLTTNSEPIPGLFAVGCDQNSVFKGAYPSGGSSIGPGMTFGYRAGLKLAAST